MCLANGDKQRMIVTSTAIVVDFMSVVKYLCDSVIL